MPTIRARVSDDEKEEIEEVAALLEEDQATTIRKALREGLGDLRVRIAVERYQAGDVSLSQAARIAGVSHAEWLEVARERSLATQLSPDDVDADVDGAREL